MTETLEDSSTGEATFSQARATNEVIKVKKARISLENLKAEHIDKQKSEAHARQLFNRSRDAWLEQSTILVDMLANKLGLPIKNLRPLIKPSIEHHLTELGEFRL